MTHGCPALPSPAPDRHPRPPPVRLWPDRLAWVVRKPDRYLVVQSLKAAAAAALAWAVTGWWLAAPMALMAPWAAVALVQGTVYRSMRTGVELLSMIASGTLLAAGSAALTGNTMTAMLIALPVAVLLGNWAPVGEQGLYAPTTALFVLAYGSYSPIAVGHRLLETLVGAAVGVTVNALVLPPVHSLQVTRLACSLPGDCARLLRRIGEGVGDDYSQARAAEWYQAAGGLYRALSELRTARAWSFESARFNPGHRLRRRVPAAPSDDWDTVWTQVSDRLLTLSLALSEAASEWRRLPRPPGEALAELGVLLVAAAEVCLVDQQAMEHGYDDELTARRHEHLGRAREAHVRMKGRQPDTDPDARASVGSLVAASQALLDDLTPSDDRSGPDPRHA
ncbi:aromatic acid exporter family protein [Streptomyces sp. NPDC017861]|uniref:FUSC family protein n=1 Tax=Streptomyces sp. NPDC017861 TaxID=3365012 RepID=UPI00190AF438|nr:FUSC family protein [Streptomyces sp. MBT51]